jgi:hypothetical protein
MTLKDKIKKGVMYFISSSANDAVPGAPIFSTELPLYIDEEKAKGKTEQEIGDTIFTKKNGKKVKF